MSSSDRAKGMRRAWKQAGHAVPLVAVGDGEKAVAYLSGAGPYGDRERFPFPSLVLLDLKLPLLSGLDVLPRLSRKVNGM